MRPIIVEGRVVRFQANPLVRVLYECSTSKMNELWMLSRDIEQLKEVYQLIGYSIAGYIEVFDAHLSQAEYEELKRLEQEALQNA